MTTEDENKQARELADKLNGLCVAEFAWSYLNQAADLLRTLSRRPAHMAGAIIAEIEPDGCATDKIDRAILCLQEAKKELNREEPRMPIADGHIEDAWHAMKQIDTTTWTEDV